MRGRTLRLLLLCAMTSGCVDHAATVTPSASPVPDASLTFASWESEWLANLAAVDARLALRMRIQAKYEDTGRAALAAILAEDPGLRVHGERADLFSFDARTRGLVALEKGLASAPRGAPGDAKELELLLRLVAEERGRVDEERQLPRSASELMRGVVATWGPPSSPPALRQRDAWLGARIDDLLPTLTREGSLDATQINELEDALDPLERLVDPAAYPDAQGALARFRVALGVVRAAPRSAMGWDALHLRLARHLGISDDETALRKELSETLAKLRSETLADLSTLGNASAHAALAKAESHLLVESVCEARGETSRVRTFGAPPERAFLCSHLREVSQGGADSEPIESVALHDVVVLASWALAIAVDGVDPADVTHGRPLLSEVAPDRMGRLIRFAAVRPVACIALARMAALLDRAGPKQRRVLAGRWLDYGDAPLDIIARDALRGAGQ